MNKKIVLSTAASLLVGVVAGTGIMLNDQAYQSVKQAVGSSATQNSLGNIDLSSMDIETALQAVQSERAKLLESQLQTQIQEVQKRNDAVSKLNECLYQLNSLRATDAADNHYSVSDELVAQLTNAGLSAPGKQLTSQELDTYIQNLKGSIDAQSNSQQMDMLRLQSLSNKRNEAFDVMTNFIKKMQDSRSSIIGNMR